MDAAVKSANTEKAKALQAALAQIEKQFGKGTIMRLGEGEAIEDRGGDLNRAAETYRRLTAAKERGQLVLLVRTPNGTQLVSVPFN